MVHAILSDSEKRALYDETGDIQDEDSELSEESFDMWYNSFRAMFPKVTLERIDDFKASYQGSQEEKVDVMKAYEKCGGRLRDILTHIMLTDDDGDDERIRGIVEGAIAAGNLKPCGDFEAGKEKSKAKGKKRKKNTKASKEAKEAEELAAMLRAKHKERQQGNAKAIATFRQREFDGIVKGLEEKYRGNGKGKGGRKATPAPPVIDEDEFLAVQQKLMANKTAREGKGIKGKRKR
ncbi:unnamed protein product [Chrysoparadoxa australica]